MGSQKSGREPRSSDTYRGASFAIRTRAARASGQTLRGSREVWVKWRRKVMEERGEEWKLG